MGNREKAVAQIEEFLESKEKCMLLTGTHQYEKHKLIMRILNKKLERHLILFRTNSMQNIENEEFLGWAKVKRNLKAGERVKIGKTFMKKLKELKNKMRFFPSKVNVFIVQPGVDSGNRNISSNMERLLCGSSSYLMETYSIPLKLICN